VKAILKPIKYRSLIAFVSICLFLMMFARARARKIMLPALAAAVIASPLPDEIGISLLASQKMESKKFLPISFTLNFLGIAGIMKLLKLGEAS